MAKDKDQQNEQNFDKTDVQAVDGRTRLKLLIVLGKERGYLTYAEINDHLPDDVQDSEQIDGIIGMINDMGIQVYEELEAQTPHSILKLLGQALSLKKRISG